MSALIALGVEAVERGLLPDRVTRAAIRQLCRQRLRESAMHTDAKHADRRARFLASMQCGPIAPLPEAANQQHYELPAELFVALLGPRLKYSCCYWADDSATLSTAEEAALAITCKRAELADGQDVLELGCGWGSLSLWMAERYPNSRITAVSNSAVQRRFILAVAARQGLKNVCVLTAEMNEFDASRCRGGAASFDRVVSVEMFEHMRNYQRLLTRIAAWLRPQGKLFVHFFCHRDYCYPFESAGTADWMGRHFFTGGLMPNARLLRQFDRHLTVTNEWSWNGCHYRRTAEAWLANLDARHDAVLQILESVYGAAVAARWVNRWRVFFLAVAELFGYAQGTQWQVAHQLLELVH